MLGHIDRKTVQELKTAKVRRESAVKIQAITRGRQGRKKANAYRQMAKQAALKTSSSGAGNFINIYV